MTFRNLFTATLELDSEHKLDSYTDAVRFLYAAPKVELELTTRWKISKYMSCLKIKKIFTSAASAKLLF
jgi:hypothetical protein